jgi:hypothetical protein
MQATYTDPSSGELVSAPFNVESDDELKPLLTHYLSKEKLQSFIESLEINAETKLILEKIASFTVSAGEVIINVGRKILEFLVMFVQKFQTASFGVVFALLISFLISAIPFLGAFFGPLLAPVLVIFGFSKGMLKDLESDHPELVGKINDAVSMFNVFNIAK